MRTRLSAMRFLFSTRAFVCVLLYITYNSAVSYSALLLIPLRRVRVHRHRCTQSCYVRYSACMCLLSVKVNKWAAKKWNTNTHTHILYSYTKAHLCQSTKWTTIGYCDEEWIIEHPSLLLFLFLPIIYCCRIPYSIRQLFLFVFFQFISFCRWNAYTHNTKRSTLEYSFMVQHCFASICFACSCSCPYALQKCKVRCFTQFCVWCVVLCRALDVIRCCVLSYLYVYVRALRRGISKSALYESALLYVMSSRTNTNSRALNNKRSAVKRVVSHLSGISNARRFWEKNLDI